MGQWMGSGQITKNLINLDLIKMTQFCHITKYRINLDLIETIQFCLKIYVLLRHPHLWVGGWVVGWVSGWGYVILLNIT